MDELSSGQLLWSAIFGDQRPELEKLDNEKLWKAVENFFLGPNCPPRMEMRDRYIKALKLRFGKDGSRLTYRAIGGILEDENGHTGITRERVRQIIHRALVVLRKYARDEIALSCLNQHRRY